RDGAQAIAVCYLFSFVNPAHERRTREICREVAPEISVSLSSEVDPTFREYERFCITAFDAYLGPVVKRYLAGLAETLRGLGVPGVPLVMRSRGGLVGAGGRRGGPLGAGAAPGPACYGRGGHQATVTDANLLLGYLDPERFADGLMTLDRAAAERAVGAVADKLGLETIAAAAGIHRVINARMADQIRLVTIKRGYDPREFALVVPGGAGPVHRVALAAAMG